MHIDYGWIDEEKEIENAKSSVFKNVDYIPNIQYCRGECYNSASYDAASKRLILRDKDFKTKVIENVVSIEFCDE